MIEKLRLGSKKLRSFRLVWYGPEHFGNGAYYRAQYGGFLLLFSPYIIPGFFRLSTLQWVYKRRMLGCQAPPSAPRQFHQKRGRATLGRLTALANNGAISASRNPAIPQPMRVTRKRVSGCSLAYSRNSST